MILTLFYVCVVSFADCPQMDGYTVTKGQDQGGYDLKCGLPSLEAAAAECTNRGDNCWAFNMYGTNLDNYCLKSFTPNVVAMNSNICFYRKSEWTYAVLLLLLVLLRM